MPSNGNTQFDTLDALVQHHMEKNQVPGATVGILKDGKVETHGYGIISLANEYPTRPDTIFQIGSQSKIFTATMIMKLAEQGKVAIDAPVAEYLPDLRLADESALGTITLRHLMTHMSGLEGDRFEDMGVGDDALAKYVGTAESWAQETAPGEHWSYCNSGWGLAGRVIETITGGVYEEVMREQIFKPLGMERTFWFAHEACMYSLSGGHTQYPGMDEPQVTIPWGLPRCVNPAGGMLSNVEDMLKWFQFHLGGGSDLLSAKTLAEMKETQTTISALPGNETDWGIGWQLGRAGGLRTFAHGGGTLGQISHSFGIPERNFAISSMTNSLRGGKVIEAIEEWVLQHELGITSPKPQPVTLSLDQLERLAGTYKVTLTTSTVELVDGQLTMRTIMRHPLTNEEMELPPVQLVPVSEWEVQTMEDGEPGGVGQFIPGPDGRASHVRMGRLAARVE